MRTIIICKGPVLVDKDTKERIDFSSMRIAPFGPGVTAYGRLFVVGCETAESVLVEFPTENLPRDFKMPSTDEELHR